MATQAGIYHDIATRTGGDIYIGVVGPVRTGKSTFIKKFMQEIVLPRIDDPAVKSRATDEMPQSGSGKNVMTTEPKFVPDDAVQIQMENDFSFRVKLIDCVGFTVPGAGGLEEDGVVRMVNTPWAKEALPFEEAATLGTQKVISEHSTVAVVVTTDGSIGDLPREAYIEAEENVIRQVQKTGKPYVVVLNSQHPDSGETIGLAKTLETKYQIPVLPKNCFALGQEDISEILNQIVLEFPVRKIKIKIPSWITTLDEQYAIKKEIFEKTDAVFRNLQKTGEIQGAITTLSENKSFESVRIASSDLGTGSINIEIKTSGEIFFSVLSDACGTDIQDESDLITRFSSMSKTKQQYDRISKALKEVEETGYGIVSPSIEDLTLDEPEIVKHAGGYGVKLRASAPSIHMIRANIQAEVSPIVGSERQSEDIVKFLLKEFEEDPKEIWHSNMFGKSLYELVNEGLNTKLNHMPEDARQKIGETLQKIINEGSSGLICIIL